MKLGIIGVGSVGGAIASSIVQSEIANELVLIDTDTTRVRSAADDLAHAAAFGDGIKITAGGYENLADADAVVISAGANQRPGQPRVELVENNAVVMLDVVPKIMRFADRSRVILIVVSNPLDSMVMAVEKISRLPAGRVIGTGTMLDSARLRHALSARFNVSPRIVNALVLGEHGDSSVVNWTGASIGGIALPDFARQLKIPFHAADKTKIERYVRNAAYEIIKGRGATWDGIAAAATDLVRCIAGDERRVLPVSMVGQVPVKTLRKSPHGGAACSMPRIVGKNGIIATLSPKMDSLESKALAASVGAIEKTYDIVA